MRNKHTGCFKGGISGVGIYQSLGRDQRGNWQHNQTRNIMTPISESWALKDLLETLAREHATMKRR